MNYPIGTIDNTVVNSYIDNMVVTKKAPSHTSSRSAQAIAVTREVRACFNRLKALGDALHADLDITAAMRAVMEALYEGHEQTVPQIARAKGVTRQHIQILVNDLAAVRLVATRVNPADRRSPVVALTRTGRAMFERMRQRETVVAEELARALGANDVDATLATLQTLHAFLDQKLNQGASDE